MTGRQPIKSLSGLDRPLMKILFVNTFYAPLEVGGAEKSVRFLAETMASMGHEATVVTLGREREHSIVGGVRVERLKVKNLYFPADATKQSSLKKLIWHTLDSFNPLSPNELSEILDDIQPDVVHTNNLSGFSVSIWKAIKKRNIPIVHTLRDYYLLCPNTAMFKDGRQCIQRCTQCSILSTPREHQTQHVDVVVGNSHFILNKHIEYQLFDNSKKCVIYNAYSPKHNKRETNPEAFTFGFIGRLSPTKGVEILLEAAKIVVADCTQKINILIAGDGDPSYVSTLKVKAKDLPVQFLGRVDPEDFYSQIDWTIVPSLWDEPLARVIFESFAHGIPVIGSATGGTPELLEDGTTGLLYTDAKDPRALALKMKQALSGSGRTFQAACLTAAEDFTPDQVYTGYYQIFESLYKKRVLSRD